MDSTLITILIRDVAVPEILALLHKHIETDETIVVTLSKDVERIKAQGQAFLDATKPTTT